jgi:ABC-type proline/glycine betaine transport system ATPase subunit
MKKLPANQPNKEIITEPANRFTHQIYGMKIRSTSSCTFSELVKQIEDERQVIYCQSEVLKNRPTYEKDIHLCIN